MTIEEKVEEKKIIEFEKSAAKVRLGLSIKSQGLAKHNLNYIKREILGGLDKKYVDIYEKLVKKYCGEKNWSNYFPIWDLELD